MIQQTSYDVFSYYGNSYSSFMTNSLKFSNPRQQRGENRILTPKLKELKTRLYVYNKQ